MKISILLIEDDRDMRDLVARHLEHSGFDVQKACLLYTSPSPRDKRQSRMPSSA